MVGGQCGKQGTQAGWSEKIKDAEYETICIFNCGGRPVDGLLQG